MELFWIDVRFQVASALILAVIVIHYASVKRIKLLSTRFFSLMLGCACFNIVFDLATVYTITHLESVAPCINRLTHQLFIASLNTMIYLMYFYVLILGRKERRTGKTPFLLLSLPYLIAIGFVIFGDLSYYNDGRVAYSYGPMATALYVCVAAYMLMANARVMRYRDSYSGRTRLALHAGTVLWMLVAVLQYCFKGLLLSGLAVTVMILHLYLSLENPGEHIDRVTNSFNRRAFELLLSEKLGRKATFCVLDLSIEDASGLNSKYGLAAVNQLMRRLSSFLSETTGENVCHYRGNALCVLLNGDAEACRPVIDSLAQRMGLPWTEHRVLLEERYRLDVLECPRFAENVEEVCQTLDSMLEVPRGANALRIVDEQDVRRQERNAAIERMLEDALEHDGFYVVYQPIRSTTDGCFHSAEALVRLKDTQTLGFVPPDEFIRIAERRGVVGSIGKVVLEKVCIMASRERLWQHGVEYIEVNLSGMQASDPEVAEEYAALMSSYGVPAAFLNFEITETAAVEAGDQTRGNIRHFTSLGCSFSIDDFGTGYSNLSQLLEMPYDLVKLDKSLIWPCFEDNSLRARVILENVSAMMHGLGKGIVAEGVETREQAELLFDLGVEHLQGYLYSKPLPEAEYLTFLQTHPCL